MFKMKKILMVGVTLALMFGFSGCDDASIAKENLKKNADNFDVYRRVIFLNGITDKTLLEIVGRCSTTNRGNQLEVICKTGPDAYKMHYLGLSDNTTYFLEQLESARVSSYHYTVRIKPQSIIPAFKLKLNESELNKAIPEVEN